MIKEDKKTFTDFSRVDFFLQIFNQNDFSVACRHHELICNVHHCLRVYTVVFVDEFKIFDFCNMQSPEVLQRFSFPVNFGSLGEADDLSR